MARINVARKSGIAGTRRNSTSTKYLFGSTIDIDNLVKYFIMKIIVLSLKLDWKSG